MLRGWDERGFVGIIKLLVESSLNNMKKYIAEALGTFALSLIVVLSVAGAFPVATPVLAGLTLALFVYSIGHISGAHINPAVTIGAWSLKKISNQDAVGYIVSQLIGGYVAMLVAGIFVRVLPVVSMPSWPILCAEALGAVFFTFGIASVVYGKTPHDASGIVVGGSLLLGIAIAGLAGTVGVLNPAVALSLGVFNWAYIAGPIVGSLIGMNLYKQLH